MKKIGFEPMIENLIDLQSIALNHSAISSFIIKAKNGI
jgi:hypothetical protein